MTKSILNMRAQVFLVSILMVTWEGLPSALFHQPTYLSRYAVAAFIIMVSLVYFVLAVSERINITLFEGISVTLFATCMAVSFISNSFIYNNSISWLYSSYAVIPILLPLCLRVLKVSSDDAIKALIATSFIVSIVLIFDQFQNFSFLDVFQRDATTDSSLRRVVFLKTETAIALTILICRLMTASSAKLFAKTSILIAPVFYTLFSLSESRLAIGAVIVAATVFWLIRINGHRKIIALCVGITIGAPILIIFLRKYIIQFSSSSSYIATDASITWRIIELEYLFDRFQETSWFGFGLMPTGSQSHNILSFAANYGGYLYDRYSYGIYLADTGILSALMQFGILGFLLVLFMSLFGSIKMISTRSCHPRSHDVAAVGAGMLGFMVSPWPINMFTLEWTVISGNLVWFILIQFGIEAARSEHFKTGKNNVAT